MSGRQQMKWESPVHEDVPNNNMTELENERENHRLSKAQRPHRRRNTYQSLRESSPGPEIDLKDLQPDQRAGSSQLQPATDTQGSFSQRSGAQQLVRQEAEEDQQIQMNENSEESGLKLRLDLNLDIEVELKAKIRGDLTLSLLS